MARKDVRFCDNPDRKRGGLIFTGEGSSEINGGKKGFG